MEQYDDTRSAQDEFPDLAPGELWSIDDVAVERVPIPEWGRAVYVKSMTGTERDAFEQSLIGGKGRNRQVNLDNFRAKLVARTARDAQDRRIFTDAEAARIGEKNAGALQRIVNVANRLSGFSDEDVEELTGNSNAGQSDDSTSA